MGYEMSAEAYERSRPGYPEPAVRYLVEALKIGSDSTILDLGAGTGKLTRRLVPVAGVVLAVEPGTAMRDALSEQVPEAEILEGTAESIPVSDQSVDAVTVGQAFHWFRGTEALAEIGRALRSSGRLGLIWNVRDLATPEHDGVEEIITPYRGDKPTFRSGGWRIAFDQSSQFGPLHTEVFPHEHWVNRDGLVDLVSSISYMGALPSAEWSSVSSRVNDLFDRLVAGADRIRLRYDTRVFWSKPTGRI
jgi:SAM-dependent methyltransferase